MALDFLYTKDGSMGITKIVPIAGVTVTKGQIVYWSSGAVTNATPANAVTSNVAGVAEETVNGVSGGSTIAVQCNRAAVFSIDSSAIAAVANVGNSTDLETAIMCNNSDAHTDEHGVVKIEKLINTTTTSSLEVSINYASPGAHV